MEDNAQIFGLPQVAEMLDIPAHRLRRMIRNEVVPGATHIIGGRRIFTVGDVEAIWMELHLIDSGVV